MCDPVSLSIASTVIGAAGTAAGAIGNMNAQKKQQDAVEAWQIKQDAFREQERARQEELRQRADAARVAGTEQLGADKQSEAQQNEAARLEHELTGDSSAAAAAPAPISASDAALAAAGDDAPQGYKTDLAKKISELTAEFKRRLGALARASSYGGTQGGLATINPIALSQTGREIDRFNNARQSSLSAYNIEKSLNPTQITYTPSPLANTFANALSVGARGMGSIAGGGGGLSGIVGATGDDIGMWGSSKSLFPYKPNQPTGAGVKLQTSGMPW